MMISMEAKNRKNITLGDLKKVYRRGQGAYLSSGSRPRIGMAQWSMARVNSFLFALRTGRFQGGKFDLDLLPKGHPLSTKE